MKNHISPLRILYMVLIICFLTGCVSRKKYEDLQAQNEKLEKSAEKMNKKLNDVKLYNKHLRDSINGIL